MAIRYALKSSSSIRKYYTFRNAWHRTTISSVFSFAVFFVEMNQIIMFFVLLEMFVLFQRSLAALHWRFDDSADYSERDDYEIARPASVHRGFLLSLSPQQKHEMCKDCFYAQLFKEAHPPGANRKRKSITTDPQGQTSTQSVITDSVQTEGAPKYELIVVNMEAEKDKPETGTQDLMFECIGINFPHKATNYESELSLSYAFRSDWMYSLYSSNEKGQTETSIVWYIGMSPEHVQMSQTKLEDDYVNIRRTLRTLLAESPEYVELVDGKDDLSGLTEQQLRFLCGSILATPTYREIGLEFSFQWMTDYDDPVEFERKSLTFYNADYNKDEWEVDCVYCRAFVDGDDFEGDYENLYLTQTYDNKHSVLVLKEKDGDLYLSKYFKDVHILKNAGEDFSARVLFEYD